MWNRVYDKDGMIVPGGEQLFKDALRTDHVITSKVEMLDETLQPVEDGDLYSKNVDNELTNFITDGSIDVDVARGTRRTAELTILNPTADFTPATQDFSSDGDWVGKVYLDRNVRMWRGVIVGGMALYVPVGTFMIDNIDVEVEQNMSQVVLTMSDRWKMLTKSIFAHKKTYHKDRSYNSIIEEWLDDAGIYERFRTIDSLNGRDSDDRRLWKGFHVEAGDSRGEWLKKLTKRWNIDIFFDPLGRLRTRDRIRVREAGAVWDYYWSDERDGMLINVTHSFSDDNLYNHVIVVGQREVGTGGNKTTKPFYKEKKNENPHSKFRISRMGDRALFIQDDSISTDHEANKALAKAWELRTQISESIQFQAIANPMLEGDDLIRIQERTLAKVDDVYRIQRFNIPFITSLQTINVSQVLRSDDI